MTGGLDGISNLGMIESAIGRPYSGYYHRIARKAAALVQSVATNHGFYDGNKRTALILMQLLLIKSGYELHHLEEDESLETAAEEMVLAAVNKELDNDGLVAWFKARIRESQ